MFNLALMNLIVILCAYILCRCFFYSLNLIDYCIAGFILYFAQIVLSLQILGIFNLLTVNNTILLNALILLIIFLVSRNKIRYGDFTIIEQFKSAFNNLKFKDRKSTRLNSSHIQKSRMPSSA